MFKPVVRYYVVNCKQKVYLNSVTVNLCTKYKVYIHNSVCIVALQALTISRKIHIQLWYTIHTLSLKTPTQNMKKV